MAMQGQGGALGRGVRGRGTGVHEAHAGEGAGRRWRGSGSRRKSQRWAMQEGATRGPAGGCSSAAAGDAWKRDDAPGGRRQHLFVDVQEEGEQGREEKLGPAIPGGKRGCRVHKVHRMFK
jgi:hypothetical protein